VTGWLATSDHRALGHASVAIMTAPNDGSGDWRRTAVATTSAEGYWSATLPAGPSRLVHAVYAGSSTTEPASSPTATISVPGRSTLRLVHRVIHFGAFGVYARFEGRLLGGWVPPSGATVAVQARDRGIWRTIATVTTGIHGRWRAHYLVTGGPGTYPIRVYIPRQGGYPWTSAYSGRATMVIKP
jgi:hypothetical protein